VSEFGRRLSFTDKNRHVTASLLASNVWGVERYTEVLPAGWPAVAGGAAGWLVLALDSLADDIGAAIMREVDEYAQPGDDEAARAVRRVAHDAVAGFAARVTRPVATAGVAFAGPASADAAAMFHDLGRLLAAEGRSLGALNAALRVGARVTWQRLQEEARRGNGNPEAFARIGEAVFWYMDELGASCAAGYAESRAELAGDIGQLRRHLLDSLTATPPAPARAIASLAQAAGWPLPRRVAAVALIPLAGSRPGPLPPDVLADLGRRDPRMLIADPDGPGRRRQLTTILHGVLTSAGPPGTRALTRPGPGAGAGAGHDPRPGPSPLAAVGPSVPLAGAADSLRWAGQALTLARRGLVRTDAGAGVIWCEDHLPTLVLLADAALAATLSREALAPLRSLPAGPADRLAGTLLAWLESANDANVAARRLHVHPQTIRYRLRQVSELFGDTLTDPDARFRLLLALRAQSLLGSVEATARSS